MKEFKEYLEQVYKEEEEKRIFFSFPYIHYTDQTGESEGGWEVSEDGKIKKFFGEIDGVIDKAEENGDVINYILPRLGDEAEDSINARFKNYKNNNWNLFKKVLLNEKVINHYKIRYEYDTKKEVKDLINKYLK